MMLHLPSTRDGSRYIPRPRKNYKSLCYNTWRSWREVGSTDDFRHWPSYSGPGLNSHCTMNESFFFLQATQLEGVSVNNWFLSRPALAAAFCPSAVSTFQEYSICIHRGNPLPRSCPTGEQHACLPSSSLAVIPESLCSQFISVPATTQDFYIVWKWDLGRWIQ